MKRELFCLFILSVDYYMKHLWPILLIYIGCQSKSSIIESRVSWELAQQRKASISDVRYELSFDIPKDKDDSIKAEQFINFKLSDLTKDVVLDFRQPADHIYSVIIEGKAVPYKLVNQHIIIEASYFSKGENTIFISFRAGDMSLNRNEEFLYTLFVPDRASTAMPCFDQPNLKAKYSFTELNSLSKLGSRHSEPISSKNTKFGPA